jgi:hypothetical protein
LEPSTCQLQLALHQPAPSDDEENGRGVEGEKDERKRESIWKKKSPHNDFIVMHV